MKVLLFGGRGQVGWQLRRSLATLGEVIALDRESTAYCGNLSDAPGLRAAVESLRPDIVVNAAAYTAVDKAEDDAANAFAINADACRTLAQATAENGSWLVHYSTDYVYDGSGDKPWIEDSPTAPLNVYGASKLAGDQAIGQCNPRHLIFRTSWVFDSWRSNFASNILKMACARSELSVVADQWGAPTRAALVADATACALHRLVREDSPERLAGVYHLAAAGITNWHAYARLLVEQGAHCGLAVVLKPQDIRAISSAAYPARARRPANSRLDTSRLRQAFDIALPQWQEGVRAVVAELCQRPTLDTP